jgi:D-glycero-D-manno-heptose 1,7-bisphosphate phosphatase
MACTRALFLDRDGVINRDFGYVNRPDNFEFIDGIFGLARTATSLGYCLIVVTNQAGIGRGYYTEADFHAVTEWMAARFAAEGAPLKDVLFSPYHPEHGVGHYRQDSPDRKPGPGMMLKAAEKHGISLAESVMLGDNDTDMLAASRAGIPVRCLFAPDGGSVSANATHRVSSLGEMAQFLTRLSSSP